MSKLCDAEVEREAKRIFRKLARGGAWLAPLDRDFFAPMAEGKLIRPKVARALVEEFVRRGWLVGRGDAGTFALSDAGEGWFLRTQTIEDPFAAQHQLRERRRIETDEGERMVTVNEGESPLGWLKTRGLIDAVAYEAGERLRRDFTIAQMTPRLGVDFSAPVVLGSRGAKSDVVLSEMVMAAKQRFARAMKAAGPGLSDLLFDVCCHLKGLEAAERAKGWPQRTAKVVLQIGLERLAEHYGMRGGAARGQVRGWRVENV